MPEISLKAYFAKLNNLLGVNSADEVVQHSRHILQSYPKNVTAYRFLGRALVLSGRWEEGREALRRVLSVYPDDYIAHLGLSEANEHLGHTDEAIWHLERAYEQNSNNRDVIEALRNLYRRYRNVENLKMQLTSAAVARQNLRSKDYAQAIDTLRSARAKMNDRLDLKLLLAQVLWEQGSHEEAAEIAIEVLKVLPDCLEANRVMAQLWLSMGRPSDAQRYVNHLEAVDPYLAVEVAQGYAPDDDVFRLDELDYVRTSQSELASARPDWLTEIGMTPMPVLENEGEQGRDDWSSLLLGTKSPADSQATAVEPGPLSRFTEITPQPEPKRTGGLTDLFGDALAAPAAELKSLFERSTGSLDDDPPGEQNLLRRATSRVEPESTGGLTDLFGDALAPHTDDLSTLFGKSTGGFGDEDAGGDDRLAWMRDAGIEMVDDDDMQPDFNSLLADDDSELPQFDASPMAWLEDHNSGMIREEDTLEPGSASAGSASHDELLSWMQQEDDFAAVSGQPAYNAAAPVESSDDSFDWLQNDPLLDGASQSEGQLATEGASLPDDDFAAFSATGTDWQNDMFEQAQAPKADTSEPAAPGGRRGLTAILQDGNFDWVNTEKTEAAGADAEMDDWLNQFGSAQQSAAATDAPDWLSDIGFSGESIPSAATANSEDDEWFEQEESERLSPAAMANAAQFAMMSADNSDDEEGDWLSALPDDADDEEAALEPDADEEETFEWGGDAPTAETDVDTGALPDWLNDYVPAEALPGTQASVAQIDWGASVSATEPDEDSALSDWLSELEPEDEDAAEMPAASSEASWTEDAGLEEEAAEETDWLAELQPASGGQAASGGDASWLAELGAVASNEQDAEAEAVSSDDMSWLSEIAPEAEIEPEAEPVASDDMSWLAEIAPEAETEPEAEPVASDDMGWLSELAPEVDTGVNEQPAAVSVDEDMSWLSNLGVGAETLVGDVPAEPVASADDDWLTELEDASAAVPEAEPVSADDMGWLAELEPASPAEPETSTSEASAVNLEDFPWMSDDADDALAEESAEPVAATMSDDADWLSELEPDEEQLPPITLQPAAPGDLEWLAELDEATEQPAVNVEDFPWMAEEADDAVAEPAAAEAEMDWLAELEPEADTGVSEQPVAVTADEDMSWLSELEPTSEPPTEAAQELAAAVTSEADDWLSDEPAAEEDAALETPAAEIPDWLAELEPESSEEAEPAAESAPEPASEDDWLEADEPDEEAAVAAEMPSWLADLEPEAADEPEAEDDAAEAVAAAAVAGAGMAAFAVLDDDEPDAEADEFAPDEEALEPTPATNAPDWLNAMVPGLDVDYEAAEDETLFVDEEDSYDADEREYAWVEDIVEEEMAAVEGAGGYTFTRPPAWFASLGGSQEGSKAEDDFPDWISDDSDLPDYLR